MGGMPGQEEANCVMHRNYKQFRTVMKAQYIQEACVRNQVRVIGQIMESIFYHMKEFGAYPIDIEEQVKGCKQKMIQADAI